MPPGPPRDAAPSPEPSVGQVLDQLHVLVAVLDGRGNVRRLNTAAQATAAPAARPAIGTPFWELGWWMGEPGRVAVQSITQRAIGGEVQRVDVAARIGERSVTLDLSLSPVRDDAGVVTAVVASGLDISERQRDGGESAGAVVRREQAARERAEAMQHLSEALGSAPDSEAVYHAVTETAAPTVGAAFANLAIRTDRPEVAELRNGPGLPGAVARRWPEMRLDVDSPIARAFRHREIEWIEDEVALRRQFPTGSGDAAASGLHALGAVPIVNADGEVVAVIGLGWPEAQPLTGQLRGTLVALAAVVAQALERARRFDAERHVAQALQQVLLPASLPHHPTLGLTARYVAAEALLSVGGDWYECFEPEPGRLVVALGDVVGRGLQAAAAVGQLRAAVAALATTASSPAALLDQLDGFVRHFPAANFTTVVCVEVELASGQIRYACAGHPPPLLVQADGSSRFLPDGRSTPLGVPVGLRPLGIDRLERGERLLLYTDGLIERRTETIDAGFDRLTRAMAEAVLQGADGPLVDVLLERSVPAGSNDDVCVLLLHRRSAPSMLQLAVEGGAEGLAATRHALRAWLEATGARSRSIDEMILAAGEALANAIEHAYLRDARPGAVVLDATIEGSSVEIVVRDVGHWRQVPAPGPRGRGLMLMNRAMDEVVLDRSSGGTRVTMRRSLEDAR